MKKLIIFATIFLFVTFLYGNLFKLGFSQDDYFHLKISQTNGSLGQFLKLGFFRSFDDRGGIYFYRPIFREYLFNIYYQLFGLDAHPFRITQFLLHFVNIYLVYKLVRKLTAKVITSYVSALFFAITAPTLGVISYLAGGIQVEGMLLFYITSILYFLKFIDLKKMKYKIISFIFFLLALGSHELAVTLPVILIGIYFLKKGINKANFISVIKDSFVLYIIIVVYFYMEIKIIGLPTGEKQYAFNFSPARLVNSYLWYFLWSIGVPETLVDFIGPGLRLNPVLLRYWGNFYQVIFPSVFSILFFLLIPLQTLVKNKVYWFFVFLFIVGIMPVVFQPSHRLYYYLEVALVGMSGIFGLSFEYLYPKKLLAGMLLLSFLLLTISSVSLGKTNYWAVERAKIAQNLIADVQNKFPDLPKGAAVYFTNDPKSPDLGPQWGNSSKQASVILSGSDALQLLYNDQTLKVYYEDIQKPKIEEQVYYLVARIYR